MRLLEPLVRLGRRWGRPLTLRQESLGSILAVFAPSTVSPSFADWPATDAACRELHLAFERMAAHVRKIA